MKNKILMLTIIILAFVVILIPLRGSYAFYSDNKDLEIINTKIGDFRDNIIKLRENDKNNNLSEDDSQGGMYRYQGTDEVANWICFGTTENCGTNDELIDKYMYRIIGITEEGQLYLLKETFIREGNTSGFAWNSQYLIKDCLSDTCEWPNTDLYKRLNGTESNGDPIFINNSEYKYMAQGNKWYSLIEEHEWMYGDTKEAKYNGNEMYAIETGKIATKRWWPDETTQTTCSSDNLCTEKDYTWSKSIPAKIGLMYVNDVNYAYPKGNPENETNLLNSWIYFQKDGYNTNFAYEWLISRYGVDDEDHAYISARDVYQGGYLYGNAMRNANGVRPVFYLNANVMISHGKGTKENPFIIAI